MPVKIPLSMDQAQLLAELEKQKKSWSDLEKEVVKLGSTADKEERKRLAQAKRIIKSQRTEQEVLQDKIKVLREAGAKDLTQRAASERAIKKLIAAENERKAAIAKAATESTEAYREEQRQITAGVAKVKQLEKANESLEDQAKEYKRQIKAAFDAGKIGADQYKASIEQVDKEQIKAKKSDPFGGGTAKLAQYAAGVLSVSAAIAGVKKAFQDYQAEVDKGVGETDRLEGARTSLVQVSDQSNFQDRLKRADAAAVKFGVDREEALAAMFDAISNEAEEHFETILENDRSIPAEVGAKFVGNFRRVFSKENLTPDQAINTGLAAAATSEFNVQTLQPQITKAAQGSKLLPGVDSSDVAAFVSVLATTSGDSTGNEVKSLQTNFGAKLIQAVDELKGLKALSPSEVTEETVAKIASLENTVGIFSGSLGSIVEALAKDENSGLRKDLVKDNRQLLALFNNASVQIDAIKKVDATIEEAQRLSGTDEALNRQKLDTFFSDPTLAAAVDKKRSEVKRDISAENALSQKGNKVIVETNELNTQLNNENAGPIGRVGATTGLAISQGVDRVREELRESRPLTTLLESVFGEFTEQSRRQTTELEKQTGLLKTKSSEPTAEAIE